MIYGTPLSKIPDIPQSIREKLRKYLWIESLEELYEFVRNTDKEILQRHLPELDVRIVEKVVSSNTTYLQNYRPMPMQYKLGYVVDDKRKRELLGYMETLTLEDIIKPKIAPKLDRAYPPEFSLLDKFGPVRDQGQRGTCVAFAVTAFREFFEGVDIDLSEQFMYWACKQLDGIPDIPGTTLVAATDALRSYGICLESTWPYVPSCNTDELGETCGEPSQSALNEATIYRMNNTKFLQTQVIDAYKSALTGYDGEIPKPIVVGVYVFESWYNSNTTWITGKIPMPLPGEVPVGGHAMTIIGYKDDPDVPGGGFFILRNSWGTQWASQSPIAPGYGMAPYAYISNYTLEAFTGAIQPVTYRKDLKSKYIQIDSLKKKDIDIYGRYISPGKKVIYNPSYPGHVKELKSSQDIKEFVERGFTWKDEDKRKLWTITRDKIADWNANLSAKHQFFNNIEDNLLRPDKKIAELLDLKAEPLELGDIPQKIFDVTQFFAKFSPEPVIVDGVPVVPKITLSDMQGLKELVHEGNEMRTYFISLKGIPYLAVATYVTFLEIKSPDKIVINNVFPNPLSFIVGDLFNAGDKSREFMKRLKHANIIFSFGFYKNSPANYPGRIVITKYSSGGWDTPIFGVSTHDAYRTALEIFTPYRMSQWINQFESVVCDIAYGLDAPIFYDKIVDSLNLSKTLIETLAKFMCVESRKLKCGYIDGVMDDIFYVEKKTEQDKSRCGVERSRSFISKLRSKRTYKEYRDIVLDALKYFGSVLLADLINKAIHKIVGNF